MFYPRNIPKTYDMYYPMIIIISKPFPHGFDTGNFAIKYF